MLTVVYKNEINWINLLAKKGNIFTFSKAQNCPLNKEIRKEPFY